LLDTQDHALAVDGGRCERNGLGDAQACGVAGGQDGAMFPAPDEVKKLNDFLWTEDDGQFLGTFGAGMMSAKDQSFLRVTL